MTGPMTNGTPTSDRVIASLWQRWTATPAAFPMPA